MDLAEGTTPTELPRAWRWRLWAAALILAAAGLRLAYLASPFALHPAP